MMQGYVTKESKTQVTKPAEVQNTAGTQVKKGG